MEELNKVRINVIGYTDGEETDDKGFFPRYVSEFEFDEVLNVLLIGNEHSQHFVLITNLSGLMSTIRRHTGALHYCVRCFHG